MICIFSGIVGAGLIGFVIVRRALAGEDEASSETMASDIEGASA